MTCERCSTASGAVGSTPDWLSGQFSLLPSREMLLLGSVMTPILA